MFNSIDSASAVETPPQRRLQFSLRTLLIAVTIVAAVAGFFRWSWLHPVEVKSAINYLLGRGEPSPAAKAAAEAERQLALAKFSRDFAPVPLAVGDWVGEDQAIRTWAASGAVCRKYCHRLTGSTIHVIAVRGVPEDNSDEIFFSACNIRMYKRVGLDDYGLGKHVQSIQKIEVETKSQEKFYHLQTFSTIGNWERPRDPEWSYRKFAEITNLQILYSASDSKSWGSWQEFDSFVVAIFPHLQDALFPHSPGSTDPYWIERPIVPRVPWLEGAVLFGSLSGLIYLSRKKKKSVAVSKSQQGSEQTIDQDICV